MRAAAIEYIWIRLLEYVRVIESLEYLLRLKRKLCTTAIRSLFLFLQHQDSERLEFSASVRRVSWLFSIV